MYIFIHTELNRNRQHPHARMHGCNQSLIGGTNGVGRREDPSVAIAARGLPLGLPPGCRAACRDAVTASEVMPHSILSEEK